MKTAALYISGLSALLLAGCAGDMRPAVTSDDVLAAQYKARAPHGVMTGIEAGMVTDSYRKNIATLPAQTPDVTGGK